MIRSLLILSLISMHGVVAMEEVTQPRSNPLAKWREQQRRQDDLSSDLPTQGVEFATFHPGGLLNKGEFVTIDLDDAQEPAYRPTMDEWENQLQSTLDKCKTTKLIQLLSPQGQPEVRRGFHFVLYKNALAQIKAHKEQEIRILTNTANPNAKCCTCCNPTYIWNRWVAPGVIVGAKLCQIGFSAWAVERAARAFLAQNPPDYYEAAANAAPAIGALIASFGELPFSVINAWRRRILKTQQAKYEYYLLSEHTIVMQDKIEAIVRETQTDVKELLARRNRNLEELDLLSQDDVPQSSSSNPFGRKNRLIEENDPVVQTDHDVMEAQFSKAIHLTTVKKK